jgi:two-component system sensor histidine kinase AlgZ
MRVGGQRDVSATRELIPGGAVWLYLFAPIGAAPLLLSGSFRAPPAEILRQVLALYVPFLTLTAAGHLVFSVLLPPAFRRAGSSAARAAMIFVGATAPPLLLGPVIAPIYRAASGRGLSTFWFTALCLVVTYALAFPATFIQRLRERSQLAEQRARREREAAVEAQLRALQARTNPHFLFNSLNTVAALIPEDPELAERTLERLADLFRYALEGGDGLRVPVAREVEMVREYLQIQSARLGERLQATVLLDPSVAELAVPRLVIQPLVENALNHGLSVNRRVALEVSVRRDGGSVVIEVSDDGPGPGKSNQAGTRTSLAELETRLRLVFGESATVGISAATGGGCVARAVFSPS